MTRFRTAALATLGCAILAAGTSAAFAQAMTRTEWGRVYQVEAGWVVNAEAVYHDAPMVNPGACGVTDAGYATDPAAGGVDLFHTLINTAVMNQREVIFLIAGCAFDKPRIISVTLR